MASQVREGGFDDVYKVYLAFSPEIGKPVYVTVSGAMSPEEEHGHSGLLSSGDIVDTLGTGDSILLSRTPVDYDRDIFLNGTLVHVPARAVVLVFDHTNWNIAQSVNVRAVDDTQAEGSRTVVISHSVLSNDEAFNHAIVRNVELNVQDDDQAAIIVTQLDPTSPGLGLAKYDGFPLDQDSLVLEGSTVTDPLPLTEVTDIYAIELAKAPAPGKTVTVTIKPQDSRVFLTSADGRFVQDSAVTLVSPGVDHVTFDSTNWNDPVIVVIHSVNDGLVQDPHNTTIFQQVTNNPGSGDPDYNAIASFSTQRLDVRVLDDESPVCCCSKALAGRWCPRATRQPARVRATPIPCA